MELCHSSWFILWVDSTGSYLLNSVHLVSSVQVDSLPFQEECEDSQCEGFPKGKHRNLMKLGP